MLQAVRKGKPPAARTLRLLCVMRKLGETKQSQGCGKPSPQFQHSPFFGATRGRLKGNVGWVGLKCTTRFGDVRWPKGKETLRKEKQMVSVSEGKELQVTRWGSKGREKKGWEIRSRTFNHGKTTMATLDAGKGTVVLKSKKSKG